MKSSGSHWRTVLRPIRGGDRVFETGEVIDVSGWRNVRQLEAMGRLGPAEEPVKKTRASKAKVVEELSSPEVVEEAL
jgi:hypothetical protein